MMNAKRRVVLGALLSSLLAAACGDDTSVGARGPKGEDGSAGSDGKDGKDGKDGGVRVCPAGGLLDGSTEGVPLGRGLSSMVALSYCDAAQTGAKDVAEYVKVLVERWSARQLGAGFQFPLSAAATDTLRVIPGLAPDIVVKWLDPLTWDANPTTAPRFGANADYIAYFGDGWTGTPTFQGDDTAGWVWVNHEYVSGSRPQATAAPTSQHRTLAAFLNYWGVLATAAASSTWSAADLAIYTDEFKKNVGGSWMRIVQDPSTGDWALDRSQRGVRYDATDATQVKVTGMTVSADRDDNGVALPANVVTGIHNDCSGGVTPWGTVITAEENAQNAYGDLETAWTSSQRFIPGAGFDPGAPIAFTTAPSPTSEFGSNPDVNASHPRDVYGFLVEIDPGVAPSEYYGKTAAGQGHRKLGAMGRANWENASFAVDRDWKLVPGKPVVMYGGNDRRGGHVYKFVSSQPYQAGMNKEQTRALLDSGKVYVAHFAGLNNAQGRQLLSTLAPPTEAAPGQGRWIELSLTSTDLAPNGAANGDATKTVGAALADLSWNGLGGFASSEDVRRALFTASLKIGAMELNRPEDVEYNPIDLSGKPRIYVAFTNHTRQVALDQNGKLYPPATHGAQSPNRGDALGGIFAIEEKDAADPSASREFSYFQVWQGSSGSSAFDAANPDNLLIDAKGGVWFGTDGNFGTNGRADGIYYLDLDPKHRAGENPSFGRAFRVAATPSDAEATGPAFSSKMGTLFFSVQHPGEDQPSSWPPR
jgi:uncharacterized protein